MIFAKEETLSRAEIEKIQLERLKETVARVYEKVPPYRKKMEDAGLRPEDIRSLSDLSRLPFVTKQDLRDNYPFGLFAVPKEELLRIHASSGTTGKPTVVGYTKGDMDVWTECVSRIACAGGATSKDVAPISDTTILSSAGAQCDHINHVKTQLPYATHVAIVCAIGYLLSGFIKNAWIVLLICEMILQGSLYFVYRTQKDKCA